MKKIMWIICFLFLSFFITAKLKEEVLELRLRVVASSNQEEDLEEKRKVALMAVSYLEKLYIADYNEYLNTIKENIGELEKEINEVVQASIKLVRYNYKSKAYNGMALKNKRVTTLLIEIKEAKGDNWWGTIYPTFLSASGEEIVEYKSWILEKITQKEKDDV